MKEQKETATLWHVAVQMMGTLTAPVAEGAIFPFDAAKSNITKRGDTNGDCNRRV
jgi:hypothetical protein